MGGVIIAVCRVLVYYISYLKFDFLIFDYLSRTAEIEEHKPNSRDEQNNQHLWKIVQLVILGCVSLVRSSTGRDPKMQKSKKNKNGQKSFADK